MTTNLRPSSCLLAIVLASGLQGACFGAAPTAHDPHYADKASWPAKFEADKAAYAKETWPAAPVLVWAGPGADSGADRGGKMLTQVDEAGIDNPANWRQANGQPATKEPDNRTDVVFPASARVSIKPALRVRHVTLAPGANVSFGDLELDGNLWIQQGAKFAFYHGNLGAADRNTFVRSDNDYPEKLFNYLRFNKRPDKSTEFLGRWWIGDQVFLHSGQFVLGPGSLFQHTDRFPFDVYPNGALVILSGTTYEGRGNYYQKNDLTVQGRLLAGTQERPLTADCTIGLSFKALGKGKASGSGAVKVSGTDDVGLLLMPNAVLSVHSSNPAKARLVFRWHRNPQATFAWGANRREGAATEGEPADIAAMPHGICMRLFGEVTFNGVVFNDVIKGGIQLPDPAAAKQWRNVSLGQGNFGGSLAELISAWTGPAPRQKANQ